DDYIYKKTDSTPPASNPYPTRRPESRSLRSHVIHISTMTTYTKKRTAPCCPFYMFMLQLS
ncbi:MAG TPA: hypothetical protein DHV89_11545, partial [Ruminococcus sp.]|nr:hypothetical protein [Ruminococcus sp.]